MSTDMQVFQEPPVRLFNPNDHIIQIPNKGGKQDYLPVQWRLVWFRNLCPQGTIETEIVLLDLDRETEEEAYVWNNDTKRSEKIIKRAPGIAVFKAVVTDGKGGKAEAYKSEKAASFGDFIEKANTGAVGRALAMLGYGTQFAEMELTEEDRIVDAPVDRKPARAYQERKPFVEGTASVNEEKPVLRNGDGTPAMPAQDEQSDVLKQMLDKCKQRAFAAGMKTKSEWIAFRKQYGHKDSDGELSLADVATMNGELTIREKAAKGAA